MYLLFASSKEASAFIYGWRNWWPYRPSNIIDVSCNHFPQVAEAIANLTPAHSGIPEKVPFQNTAEGLRAFCGVQKVALTELELGLSPAIKMAA